MPITRDLNGKACAQLPALACTRHKRDTRVALGQQRAFVRCVIADETESGGCKRAVAATAAAAAAAPWHGYKQRAACDGVAAALCARACANYSFHRSADAHGCFGLAFGGKARPFGGRVERTSSRRVDRGQ
eukprot:6207535-Pleurochrysis_carterae.AAC.1